MPNSGRDMIRPADLPKTNTKDMTGRSYELVQKYPKDPRAQLFRGLYFLEKRNLADAEPYLREALRLGENNPVMTPAFSNWTRALLALDLDYRGRRPEALTFAQPACSAPDPNDQWKAHAPAARALPVGYRVEAGIRRASVGFFCRLPCCRAHSGRDSSSRH